jgi:uncharacterized surface protein with fasciclin (FAS1) repeats
MEEKMFKKLFAVSLIALPLMGVAAIAGSAQKDIVDTAVQAGSFNTLAKALQAADLVSTLKGNGPYTVFAPTDEAFAKLPEGALQSLLDNPEQLKKVLLLHVVPGKVMAADVMKMDSAKTAEGSDLSIEVRSNKVMVNDSTVTKTDIVASNGVIHVIDSVILPN